MVWLCFDETLHPIANNVFAKEVQVSGHDPPSSSIQGPGLAVSPFSIQGRPLWAWVSLSSEPHPPTRATPSGHTVGPTRLLHINLANSDRKARYVIDKHSDWERCVHA